MKKFKNLSLYKWIFFIHFIFIAQYSWAVQSLTVTLNPWFHSINPNTISFEGVFVANQIFEPLMKIKPDGSIVGYLINSWSVGANYKIFNFKLNPNIYFSNGTHLTTQHVQTAINEAIQSQMWTPLERILGAKDYQQKKTKIIRGLKIINDQEFIIETTLPFPNLVLELAESNIDVFLRQKNSDTLLGTGPYFLKNFDRQNKILTLQKNPFYKRKNIYYENIVINNNESINTDISETLPEKDKISQYNSKEYFFAKVYYLGFNANNNKLDNLQTRKYLACLLPDQKLGYAHDSFTPMGIFGYNESIYFNCNNSTPPKKLSKNFNVTYYLDSFAEIAQKYCNTLILNSIQCKIQKISSGEELKKLKDNGSLEIFIGRFNFSVLLPEDVLLTFLKSHPTNFFDTEDTVFSSSFTKTIEKLYSISPTSKKELWDVYTTLNKLIINNYIARPISYGTAEKLWVKKNIRIPDIGIMGITALDLTEVKPL